MIVDLMKLNVRVVHDLIVWCVANDIDRERAVQLNFQWYCAPEHWEDIEWKLDIPDELWAWWVLKIPAEELFPSD